MATQLPLLVKCGDCGDKSWQYFADLHYQDCEMKIGALERPFGGGGGDMVLAQVHGK